MKYFGKKQGTVPHAQNQGFYDPRAMEQMVFQRYGQSNVIGSSVPGKSMSNVRKANGCIELKSVPGARVDFDKRGFPIFDSYAVAEARIPWSKANIPDSSAHMRAATRALRTEIKAGRIPRSLFTPKQLKDITSGSERIQGFTWHHHQEIGRMQLIPRAIHEEIDHVGGMSMWFSKETKLLFSGKKGKK